MATTSYPAVGNGGLTATDWASMYGCPDGIVNDLSGQAFALTRINSGDIARLAAGIACVNGYFLENDGAYDLTVPTAAGTYWIAVMYDPDLNVADENGDASPLGPCRLVIDTPSFFTEADGRRFTLLYSIVRTVGQTLTAATVNNHRQHVGANLTVEKVAPHMLTIPETPLVGYQHPVGTSIFERSTGEVRRKIPNPSGGGTVWQRDAYRGPFNFPHPASLGPVVPDEAPRYHLTDHVAVVRFEGSLKRVNGQPLTAGLDVILGTMPVQHRPAKQVRLSCVGKAASKWRNVQVTVRASDGAVVLYDPFDFEILWLDLAGIAYRLKDN
jgi:hypothetical protein